MPATLEAAGVVGSVVTDRPFRFTAALEQLGRLAAFKSNWDGYGAGPIKTTIRDAVKSFLDRLSDVPSARPPRESATFPAVVPLSSGAVQLEWHVGERILELEFETAEVIHFLKWWPQKGVAVEGTYPANDLSHSTTLLEWVLSGRDSQ